MHNAKRFSRLFLLSCFLSAQAFPQTTGSISGVVFNDQGQALEGALVLYNNIAPGRLGPDGRWAPVGVEIRDSARAARDGSFRVGELPPGEYHVCARGTQPQHLDSCGWGVPPPLVAVKVGRDVSVRLTVRTGALLHLRIQDPDPRLVDEKQFNIGVMSDTGTYVRARLEPRTGSEAHLRMAVPKGVALKLFPGARLEFTDSAGTPLVTGRPHLPILVGQQDELTVRLTAR